VELRISVAAINEPMGKLANISGKDAVKAFEKVGWLARGQVGSHRVLTKSGVRSNLTVPMHTELAPGTLRALIKVAGLTVDEFLALL
jgi:predicted RNA binding protein YcfA (HicA-like mRNA interferase family)